MVKLTFINSINIYVVLNMSQELENRAVNKEVNSCAKKWIHGIYMEQQEIADIWLFFTPPKKNKLQLNMDQPNNCLVAYK